MSGRNAARDEWFQHSRAIPAAVPGRRRRRIQPAAACDRDVCLPGCLNHRRAVDALETLIPRLHQRIPFRVVREFERRGGVEMEPDAAAQPQGADEKFARGHDHASATAPVTGIDGILDGACVVAPAVSAKAVDRVGRGRDRGQGRARDDGVRRGRAGGIGRRRQGWRRRDGTHAPRDHRSGRAKGPGGEDPATAPSRTAHDCCTAGARVRAASTATRTRTGRIREARSEIVVASSVSSISSRQIA